MIIAPTIMPNFLRMIFIASEQVTEQVIKFLTVMGKDDISAVVLMEKVNIKHRPSFLYNYLQPSLENGFIEKPNSRVQKYRITLKGKLKIKNTKKQ